MPPRAFIAGASGLIGSHLLLHLLADYDRVVALTRRPLAVRNSNLEERSLEAPGFARDDAAKDAVLFITLGTTIKKAGSQQAFREVDFELPLRLAREAVSAGVRQYSIVTSVDANPESNNFYLRTKGELEKEIFALPFEIVQIFRPSFLTGERAEPRPGERIGIAAARLLSPLLIGGLRKYRAIPAEAVAKAMAKAARESQPGRRVYHYDDIISLSK